MFATPYYLGVNFSRLAHLADLPLGELLSSPDVQKPSNAGIFLSGWHPMVGNAVNAIEQTDALDPMAPGWPATGSYTSGGVEIGVRLLLIAPSVTEAQHHEDLRRTHFLIIDGILAASRRTPLGQTGNAPKPELLRN